MTNIKYFTSSAIITILEKIILIQNTHIIAYQDSDVNIKIYNRSTINKRKSICLNITKTEINHIQTIECSWKTN